LLSFPPPSDPSVCWEFLRCPESPMAPSRQTAAGAGSDYHHTWFQCLLHRRKGGKSNPQQTVRSSGIARLAALLTAAITVLPGCPQAFAGSWSAGLFPGGGASSSRLVIRQALESGPEGTIKPGKLWKGSTLREREVSDYNDPLEWPRETCEVMVDAMSVTRWYWKKAKKADQELVLTHDLFAYWPIRVFNMIKLLSKEYGKEKPPSPWAPVVAVFDLPNAEQTWSGLQVKKWKNLSRQGPRYVNGVTLAWSQTFVDMSASGKMRCDREILYMLESLTRDFPRRQVLVTGCKYLAADAKRFCTVRSPQWLEQEILARHGQEGAAAVKAMEGGPEGVEEALKGLPQKVKAAWTAT